MVMLTYSIAKPDLYQQQINAYGAENCICFYGKGGNCSSERLQ